MPILGLKVPGPSKPAHFSLEPLIRPNILALQPYRCARDDYSAGVLLDANENSLGAAFIAGASDAPDASAQPNGSAKTQTNGSSTSSNGASAADNATRSTGASSESIAADTLSLLSPGELLELNRYPSPTHDELKCRIAEYRGVPDENWVFLGVGSDEVIDMLYRVLCVPGKDRVMTLPPTYGMYKVTANVNDVGVLEVPLITEGGAFQMDEQAVRALSL
jgi:histidinol-phosphate aminotransferase